MKYTTVYVTSRPSEISLLENLFGESNLDFRTLKGPNNDTTPEEVKFQVEEDQKERANRLLLDKGYLQKPPITQEGSRKSRFWIFLLIVIVIVVVIGFVVNLLMNRW